MKQQVDLFTPIHKAIRAMLYQLGSELQCANMTNKEECRLMVDKLEHSLELLEEHARHEDEIIFPAIDKALPGITEESTEEHEAYAKKVEQLRSLLSDFPERYTEWLQWMLPAMDLGELVPLFRQVRQNAPPEVVQKFEIIGNEYIPKHRWNSLHEMMN